MKGKFINIGPLIILCVCIAMGVVACVSPVNIGELLDDDKIKDIIGGGGVVIDLEVPEDYAPALQWSRYPLYANWTDFNRGETVSINYGDTIRIRAYALPGDFQSYSWHLGDTSLTEFIPGMLEVDANTAPFDINPAARYMVTLIAYKDSVPYSTYFYIVVN